MIDSADPAPPPDGIPGPAGFSQFAAAPWLRMAASDLVVCLAVSGLALPSLWELVHPLPLTIEHVMLSAARSVAFVVILVTRIKQLVLARRIADSDQTLRRVEKQAARQQHELD